MTSDEKKNYYLNRNVKLFPPFLAMTWDVIFVWTISTLFFTEVKGLTYSQVVSLDSILMIFGCLLCIPLTQLFRKIPPLTTSRLGACGYGIYLLICIFGNHYAWFIFAQLFLAFGYVCCGIKGNLILTRSLNMLKRGKDYNRIYGKGLGLYYFLECVGAILITYVYNWNPISAYWVSFGVVVFVLLYSFLLVEPQKFQQSNVQLQTGTQHPNNQPDKYTTILKTTFFISLLVFMFMIRGLLSITTSNYKIYLQEMVNLNKIPVWAFGYLFACGRLFSSIATKYQFKLDLRFGVKSIVIITSLIVLTFVTNGVLFLINPTSTLTMIIIILSSCVQVALLGPVRIFVNNYMQNLIPHKNIERAYSIRTMVEYFGFAVVSALYSLLLTLFNDNYAYVNLTYIAILIVPLSLATIMFIRVLIRRYAQSKTIIRPEIENEKDTQN